MERKKPCKVGENKSDIVREVPLACADELAAVEFMEKRRWGDEPTCPCCESRNVYKMTRRGSEQREKHFRWRCRDCGSLYSVRKGTVFEDSRIPMRHWCFAMWAACSSKKGVSAKQVQRQTGLSYKSALFLMHRIRFAMQDDTGDKLTGIVEADETYIGGKSRSLSRRKKQKVPFQTGHTTRYDRQTAVYGAVERGGRVRTRFMPNVTAMNMREVVEDTIDVSARLVTDEHRCYIGVGKRFKGGHDTIAHKNNIYAQGDVTTNTIEGFFSLVKRGIYGTFHAVSKKHLHRYMDEFAFRYNTRKVDDGERMRLAVEGAVGKRLVY